MMGGEATPSASPTAAGSSPPRGKRARDPEDEVYLDNFHNHKRYLSQIMASSLNGLTVGDSLGDNLMDSPARSDGMCYLRDEVCSPYSPMSEDSDDARYCDAPPTSISMPDFSSRPTSPVSPHRHQRLGWGLSPSNPYPLPGCTLPAVVCSYSRQRGSDAEGRFPSSPNDMCHSADLRRAALLRSVQMRTQPHCAASYELSFDNSQESSPCIEEVDDRPFPETKALEAHKAESENALEQVGSAHMEFSSTEGEEPSDLEHVCEKKCYEIKYESIGGEGSL